MIIIMHIMSRSLIAECPNLRVLAEMDGWEGIGLLLFIYVTTNVKHKISFTTVSSVKQNVVLSNAVQSVLYWKKFLTSQTCFTHCKRNQLTFIAFVLETRELQELRAEIKFKNWDLDTYILWGGNYWIVYNYMEINRTRYNIAT